MTLPMDDNLRGLLLELAERPQRTVLGSRVRRFQDLLRPEVEMLRPTAGMGVVEAKLLEAHREELAWLLLLASRQTLLARGDLVLAARDERGVRQDASWQDLADRTQALTAERFVEAEPLGATQLLSAAVLGESKGAQVPRELAIASLRLDPRQATRLWLATHLGIEGDARRAIELQFPILNQLGSHLLAYAWSNIAGENARLCRFHDALEAGRAAHVAMPSFARGAVAWFMAAVQCGDLSESHCAASALSSVLQEDSDEADEYVSFANQGRSRNAWRPTRASASIVGSHGFSVTAEKILEVFC